MSSKIVSSLNDLLAARILKSKSVRKEQMDAILQNIRLLSDARFKEEKAAIETISEAKEPKAARREPEERKVFSITIERLLKERQELANVLKAMQLSPQFPILGFQTEQYKNQLKLMHEKNAELVAKENVVDDPQYPLEFFSVAELKQHLDYLTNLLTSESGKSEPKERMIALSIRMHKIQNIIDDIYATFDGERYYSSIEYMDNQIVVAMTSKKDGKFTTLKFGKIENAIDAIKKLDVSIEELKKGEVWEKSSVQETDWADLDLVQGRSKNGLAPIPVPLRNSLTVDQRRTEYKQDMINAIYNILIQYDNLKKFKVVLYKAGSQSCDLHVWVENIDHSQRPYSRIVPVEMNVAQLRYIYYLEEKIHMLIEKGDGSNEIASNRHLDQNLLFKPNIVFDNITTRESIVYATLEMVAPHDADFKKANQMLMKNLNVKAVDPEFGKDPLAWYILDLAKYCTVNIKLADSKMQFSADDQGRPKGARRPEREYYVIKIQFAFDLGLGNLLFHCMRNDLLDWFKLVKGFTAHYLPRYGRMAFEHIQEKGYHTLVIPRKNDEGEDMINYLKRFFQGKNIILELPQEYGAIPKPAPELSKPGQPTPTLTTIKEVELSGDKPIGIIKETDKYILEETEHTQKRGVLVWLIKLKPSVNLSRDDYKSFMREIGYIGGGAYWWKAAQKIVLNRDGKELRALKDKVIAVIEKYAHS